MKFGLRIKVFLILLIIVAPALSFGKDKGSWPFANHKGTIRMGYGYVIGPKLKRPVFNEGYFIEAAEGTPVISISDGMIETIVPYFYLSPNLNHSLSTSSPPVEQTLKKYGIRVDEFSTSISINIGSDSKILYCGLSPNITVNVGQRIKKGDIIGYSAYMKSILDSPVIHISMSKNKSPADIGTLLFGKGYIPKYYLKEKPESYTPNLTYSPSELQKDFKLLREALEEGHPGLYTYTSKEEFNGLLNEAAQKLTVPMTEDDFVRIILPLISKIGCVHTNVIRSTPYWQYNKPLLPFEIRFIYVDSQTLSCLITNNWSSNNPLPIGTEIKSINGASMNEIRKRMLENTEGDGFNETFRLQWIERDFKNNYYTIFGSFHEFNLEIKTPAGESKKVTVMAMMNHDLAKKKQSEQSDVKKNKAKYSNLPGNTPGPGDIKDSVVFKLLSPDKAYLKVSEFSVFNRKDITGFFKTLEDKKIPSLIVDMRDNPGGNADNLAFLYSFFAKKPFSLQAYKKVYIRGKYKFFKYTENLPDNVEYNMQFPETKTEDGYILPVSKTNPQEKYNYQGKVYVLMNGGTSSAAAEFCSIVHRQKRGILIGEEAGGDHYELNANSFAFLELRHVPVKIRIPLIKIVNSGEIEPSIPKGRGVIPDVRVTRSLKDILNPESDSILKYTIQLIDR